MMMMIFLIVKVFFTQSYVDYILPHLQFPQQYNIQMSEVEAISFDQVECGKKVSESKKRFKWRFKIKGHTYLMELANSTISGKRIVTLDSFEIYTEKNFFNINFDFMHKIEGHIFRITRTPDNINKFQLRVDNRNFQDMLNKTNEEDREATGQSKYKKQEVDPFSQFGNFAAPVKAESKSSDFGEFDFDSFAKPVSKQDSQKEVLEKTGSTKQVFDPFVNYSKPVAATYETVNFQTNSFQTNNFGGNFAENFSKVEQNLLDEDNFATNNFDRNNLYNQFLNQKPSQASEVWSQFPQPEEKNTFKIELTSKQVVNKVKKAAEEIKNKITGVSDSLI